MMNSGLLWCYIIEFLTTLTFHLPIQWLMRSVKGFVLLHHSWATKIDFLLAAFQTWVLYVAKLIAKIPGARLFSDRVIANELLKDTLHAPRHGCTVASSSPVNFTCSRIYTTVPPPFLLRQGMFKNWPAS